LEDTSLIEETLGEAKLLSLVDTLFGHGDGRSGFLCDFLSNLESFIDELISGKNARDETSLSSFLSTHEVTSKAHLHRSALSDSSSESLGATHTWNNTEIDFRLSKFSSITCKKNIAHHSEFATTSESKAIDCTDEWCLKISNLVPPSEHISHVGVWELTWLHLLDICSSCESFLTTSKNNSLNFGIFIESS